MSSEVFYHVYNRGINGEDIFKEERNYLFFLKQYAKYILPIAETYAYCLMKNHFHLLVRTRSAEEIIRNTTTMNVGRVPPNVGRVQNPADVTTPNETDASKCISNQFSKLFNSYAQAINKSFKRTGGLFEEPFRRIAIADETYLVQLVYYIHANPQKHGFIDNFRNYPYSSYHTHLSKLDTKLNRLEVLRWFNDNDGYQEYHLPNQVLADLPKFEIEFD